MGYLLKDKPQWLKTIPVVKCLHLSDTNARDRFREGKSSSQFGSNMLYKFQFVQKHNILRALLRFWNWYAEDKSSFVVFRRKIKFL